MKKGDEYSAKPAGFTLIEVLVVIAVVALLIAILMPRLSFARAQARRTVCGANLHGLGLAMNLYLDVNNGSFFRYYRDVPAGTAEFPTAGRQWWFGFETTGLGLTSKRPLDKSLSPLAPYTAKLAYQMQCPDFPYDDPGFFPKFDQRAASYGFNLTLGPIFGPAKSRSTFASRQQTVFAFADGVHFDFNPLVNFNEAHYITYTSPLSASGYAHFRHQKQAQVVFLDGHVDLQPLAGGAGGNYRDVAGSPTGNLSLPGGPGGAAIYGN